MGKNNEINFKEGKIQSKERERWFCKAINLVKTSDVAIVVVGESRNMSGEARSRNIRPALCSRKFC